MRDQAVARAAVPSIQIRVNDVKVVLGHVRKIRAPGGLSHRPNIRRGRFQAIVHWYVPSLSDFNSRLFQPDSLGIRDTAKRSQNVRCGCWLTRRASTCLMKQANLTRMQSTIR